MNKIIKVSDFLDNEMNDMLMDYFEFLIDPENMNSHFLNLPKDKFESDLLKILKFFNQIAANNDTYVICSGIDKLCMKLEDHQKSNIIFGDKMKKFSDYTNISMCVAPNWPAHQVATIMNRIFDNINPADKMFIVLF